MTRKHLETLWYTRCGVPTALGLAARLGWLEQTFGGDGTKIASLRDSDDQDVRRSHFDHRLAYSVRQGGSSPAIWARAQGRDTRLIGLIWTDESQQILTLPGRKIQSVKDLKGRKLALPHHQSDDLPRLDIRGAAALRGFLAALATEGLDERDVQFVKLAKVEQREPNNRAAHRGFAYGFGEEVLALLNGEVDAIFVKDARGKAIESFLGAVEVIDVGNHPDPAVRVNYGVPRTLTVDGALARDYPEVVERLLGLVLEAGQWAQEHPRDALELAAREVAMPVHFAELAYPRLPTQLRTDLREDWIGHLEAYKDFLLKWGFLTADFEVHAWIDRAPLAALRERSVAQRDASSQGAAPGPTGRGGVLPAGQTNTSLV
ncbi:MAG: ABC transporter substrate-binding protein [Myxococcales bacterium]